jgi:hypothetical protein
MVDDGASVLGTNNKYEFAKGASIGWNVTRESFMSNVTWLNNLKLRASMELNSTSGTTNYGAQNFLVLHLWRKYWYYSRQ